MNSITIGPLFVPASPPPAPDPEVVPLGVSIEMAGADGSYQAPLYRKASRWNPHLCKLTDILVHEADLPCEFSYRPIFAAQTQNGMFIPLESLLVGLYESFQMPRSIFAVFTDLRDMVEFSEGMLPPRRPLTPAAAKLGFEVNHVESYSQRLLVDIDWFPPQDRRHVAAGDGAWVQSERGHRGVAEVQAGVWCGTEGAIDGARDEDGLRQS